MRVELAESAEQSFSDMGVTARGGPEAGNAGARPCGWTLVSKRAGRADQKGEPGGPAPAVGSASTRELDFTLRAVGT